MNIIDSYKKTQLSKFVHSSDVRKLKRLYLYIQDITLVHIFKLIKQIHFQNNEAEKFICDHLYQMNYIQP